MITNNEKINILNNYLSNIEFQLNHVLNNPVVVVEGKEQIDIIGYMQDLNRQKMAIQKELDKV